MRSPEGLIPLWALLVIEAFDKLPSKANWIEQSISGISALPSSDFFNGPSKTNNKWDGESDNNWRSFGEFL